MRRRLAVQCAVLLAVGGAAYGIGGVADGGPPEGELIVVQDVPSDVRAELDVAVQEAADVVEKIVADGPERAMEFANRKQS